MGHNAVVPPVTDLRVLYFCIYVCIKFILFAIQLFVVLINWLRLLLRISVFMLRVYAAATALKRMWPEPAQTSPEPPDRGGARE